MFHAEVVVLSLILVFTQFVLILSGNLSFLNWLTILPSIFCLDDRFLQFLFTDWTVTRVKDLQQKEKTEEKYPVGAYVAYIYI